MKMPPFLSGVSWILICFMGYSKNGTEERMLKQEIKRQIEQIYPATRSRMDKIVWERILDRIQSGTSPARFPDEMGSLTRKGDIPPFLADLARLESAIAKSSALQGYMPSSVVSIMLNPTLQVLQFPWKGLSALADPGKKFVHAPEREDEIVLVWYHPLEGKVRFRPAGGDDLLPLKIVMEEISREDAAREGNVTIGTIDDMMYRAGKRGLLITPPTKIRRNEESFPKGKDIDEQFLSSDVFTLQWHITQVCDLRCKHCYDRSSIRSMAFEDALSILDDLRRFCLDRNVTGHISFTGGNPLMYPNFSNLYREASERGFSLAILGNPAEKESIEEIVRIQKPAFYQVSLEGLRKHNDEIRGEGHFERVERFLPILKELGLYSMVMLTLTEHNRDQVLPLAEYLRDRVDFFTFNRISLVGEGARLVPSDRESYSKFLEDYLEAARNNPIMGLKDNLINIIRRKRGMRPFGGCAGHGCSAAFNFITLLPDGEAHACRKFPSPIGNVLEQGIAGVYDSEKAERYRRGCAECEECEIRPVCGGCLAVAHSFGMDEFREKDPYCFFS